MNKHLAKEDYVKIFMDSHPGFFTGHELDYMPEGVTCEEMFLPLENFKADDYEIKVSDDVTFGFYQGDFDELLESVGRVVKGWPEFFSPKNEIFCGYKDGKTASFCLIENMGTHTIGSRQIKVGGPGCVGTLPEYRKQGIGLAMVNLVTDILRERGYDYSYIHYTGVAKWYSKLGYRTEVVWDKHGIID